MDNEIQSLLNSPLPDDRKLGLEMLADSSDPQALKALSAMHKRETNPEIKQMIIQVGKGIKRRAENAATFESSSNIGDLAKSSRSNTQQWADELSSDYGVDKPKRKNEFQTDETSWGTALMDVGLYGLFSGGILFVAMLFIVYIMGGLLETMATSPEFSNSGEFDITEVAAFFDSLGLMLALIYGVIGALASMIGYMIWFGVIHIVSTMILGGNGRYTGMLHHAFLPMIVWLIVSFVLGAVGGYFAFSSIESFETIEQMQSASAVNNLMSVINFAASIGFLLWISSVIGRNYQFGTGKGCVSVIVSYIAIFAAVCGCYFVIIMAIVNGASQSAFEGFIPLFF